MREYEVTLNPNNRSALIRVPLGWIARTNMIRDANPYERYDVPYIPGKFMKLVEKYMHHM